MDNGQWHGWMGFGLYNEKNTLIYISIDILFLYIAWVLDNGKHTTTPRYLT
jgi:hypothetical protein